MLVPHSHAREPTKPHDMPQLPKLENHPMQSPALYTRRSSRDACTSALNSLDLLRRPDTPPEACWQLVTVKEHALGGSDRGQSSGGSAANAGFCETGQGATQRAMLLRAVTVLGEG